MFFCFAERFNLQEPETIKLNIIVEVEFDNDDILEVDLVERMNG